MMAFLPVQHYFIATPWSASPYHLYKGAFNRLSRPDMALTQAHKPHFRDNEAMLTLEPPATRLRCACFLVA